MKIAFDISRFACLGDIFRDVGGVVVSEQIVFVVFVDVGVFGSDVYSFYVGAFLLDLGHDFKAQVVEIASAAKQKGIGVSVVDQGEEKLFKLLAEAVVKLRLPMSDKGNRHNFLLRYIIKNSEK